MVTILVCLVVLGGAAAAILLARAALRQPATDVPGRHLGRRRRALRAGAGRATAFLIPSGPPTTAHVRYRAEPVAPGPAPAAGDEREPVTPVAPEPVHVEPEPVVVEPEARPEPVTVELDPEPVAVEPRPVPARPPAHVAARWEPVADLHDRDDERDERFLEPALLGFPSAPPSSGARAMVLSPARLLTSRLLAARASEPQVVAPVAGPVAVAATAVVEVDEDAGPQPQVEDDLAAERRPQPEGRGRPEPSPVRRVLRRLKGATLLVTLLVALGLVLAVVLVGTLGLVALGVRAAVAG